MQSGLERLWQKGMVAVYEDRQEVDSEVWCIAGGILDACRGRHGVFDADIRGKRV